MIQYRTQTVHTIETPKRVVWVRAYYVGGFEVRYQPVNAKTGKPWQAERGVCEGADAIVWHKEDRENVVEVNGTGRVPDHANWPQGAQMATPCLYSTLDKAIAAAERAAAK